MSPARTFARLSVRWRVWIVLAWLGVTAASVALLPPLASTSGAGLGGLVPRESAALRAEIASIREFGFPLLSRTAVVQRNPEGLSSFAQARVLLRAANVTRGLYPNLRIIAGALPITNSLGLFRTANERGTTAVTYLFFLPEVGVGTRELLANKLVRLQMDPQLDAPVGVTGAVPGRLEQVRLIAEHLPAVELLTVLVILVIVGVHWALGGAGLVLGVLIGLLIGTLLGGDDESDGTTAGVPPACAEAIAAAREELAARQETIDLPAELGAVGEEAAEAIRTLDTARLEQIFADLERLRQRATAAAEEISSNEFETRADACEAVAAGEG